MSMHAAGLANATHDEPHKFDEQLPAEGWKIQLARNTFLGEMVGQIPRSAKIITPEQTNARNDKEWHLIVHEIAPVLDGSLKDIGLEKGDRVVVSGAATQTFFNGMEFQIVPFNAVQAILRHENGKWIGSKYGEKALTEGKPKD